MGLREEWGGKLEEMLFDAVDGFDVEALKVKLHGEVDKLVDDHVGELKQKLKELIDKLDGEKDL